MNTKQSGRSKGNSLLLVFVAHLTAPPTNPYLEFFAVAQLVCVVSNSATSWTLAHPY